MYINTKQQEKVRRDVAVYALKHGIRPASRHYGYAPSAISNWVKYINKMGIHPTPTKSSRPKNSPNKIDPLLEDRICSIRKENNRYAEVIQGELKRERDVVPLSTIKRVLERNYLIKKRSPWKRFHPHIDRPIPEKPGSLVQLDSIHTMIGSKTRIYTLTIIDVYGRVGYAKTYSRLDSKISLKFIKEAQRYTGFYFDMLQTDKGPEFGSWFVEQVKKSHRYTRTGKPNDNAHIERFNRTIQEECLDKIYPSVKSFNKALKQYLEYYNYQRLHIGLKLKTPREVSGVFSRC